MNLTTVDNTEYVMTLKEVTDLISVRHDKAMKKIEELQKEEGFGGLSKMDTPTYNPDGSINRYIQTYNLTRKQAVAAGAILNNALLMKVINRLEELESKPKELTPIEMAQNFIVAEKARLELLEKTKRLEEDKQILGSQLADKTIESEHMKSNIKKIGTVLRKLNEAGPDDTTISTWAKEVRDKDLV